MLQTNKQTKNCVTTDSHLELNLHVENNIMMYKCYIVVIVVHQNKWINKIQVLGILLGNGWISVRIIDGCNSDIYTYNKHFQFGSNIRFNTLADTADAIIQYFVIWDSSSGDGSFGTRGTKHRAPPAGRNLEINIILDKFMTKIYFRLLLIIL